MSDKHTQDRFGLREELIMEFPCDFPIKVVGLSDVQFSLQICAIAARHDEHFSPEEKVDFKQSSGGKYQSLTLSIRAHSKEQIDALYQDLKACEMVLWAL